jgi:hypothetical protein
MFDEPHARSLAHASVVERQPLGPARELDDGWFFPFYKEAQLGSHGVVVNKRTGAILRLGSAFPVDRDLMFYDRGFQFERYDLVVTVVHDMRAARRAVASLPLDVVEATYENGRVVRAPRTLTDMERKQWLEKLPCVFPAVALSFHYEVLERVRRERWFEFVALEYREPGTVR